MRMELSQAVVLHKLDIAHRPVEDGGALSSRTTWRARLTSCSIAIGMPRLGSG